MKNYHPFHWLKLTILFLLWCSTAALAQAPTVQLTYPASGNIFANVRAINLNAQAVAFGAGNSIQKVEFLGDGELLGEDRTAPYTCNVPIADGVNGTILLQVRATDNLNQTTTSAVSEVTVINSSPTVTITSPATNTTFQTPATINITANARDAIGIRKVEFYNGSSMLGEDQSSPFTFSWQGVKAGTYTLTVKAYNLAMASTTSAPITVKVVDIISATITSPANNAVYNQGATIPITANAAHPAGIKKVEFFSGTTKLGEDLTAPYAYNWTGAVAGSYALTVKATDNTNNTTTSIPVAVRVINNQPPTVQISSPATGSTYLSLTPIPLTATATDNDGTVTKVEFFNGTTKLGEDLTAPYSYTWNGAGIGTYSVTAKATDNTNKTTLSAPVTISVVNRAPTVRITSPNNNATYFDAAIRIAVEASDVDGNIAKVQFYVGNTIVAEDLTAPYEFLWGRSTIEPATTTYILTAKAIDNLNQATTSAPVTISITKSPPAVSLTSPSSGASYTGPATIQLTAAASVYNGSISNVSFYRVDTNTNALTLLGRDLTAPYSYTWTKVAPGTYQLTALATDNLGRGSFSSPVTVVVNAPAIAANTRNQVEAATAQDVQQEKVFQSYPNPFTTTSTLAFAFDQKEEYEIQIYDAWGTLVKALPPGQVEANTWMEVQWADTKMLPGTYLIKLTSSKGVQTLRVVRE